MGYKKSRDAYVREKTYKESKLPYSFTYKMRHAFWGKKCPICGVEMRIHQFTGNDLIPSIQHNKPIAKGGKHEIDNISIICKRCNVSIRDNETPSLNNEEVKKVWEEIQKNERKKNV